MAMQYVKAGFISAEELVEEFKKAGRLDAASQVEEVLQTLKTRSRFAGYIVVGTSPMPMAVATTNSIHKVPSGGVLLYGSYATIFPTREDAEEAIKRTEAYCAEHYYTWFNKKSILPVAPVGVIFE